MSGPATLYQAGVHGSRPANGSGCVLYACSTHDLVYRDDGVTWTTFMSLVGATSTATDAIWDNAGDLVQATGANTAAKIPIGTALQVLRVNAGATAAEWAAAPGAWPQVARVTRTAGDVTTTSTTYVDLTGATWTASTGARRLLVTFVATAYCSTANAGMKFRLDIDGGAIGGTIGQIVSANPANTEQLIAFTYLSDVLSAASHTVKVQWCVAAGTGTVYANSSTAPYVLTVIETLQTT